VRKGGIGRQPSLLSTMMGGGIIRQPSLLSDVREGGSSDNHQCGRTCGRRHHPTTITVVGRAGGIIRQTSLLSDDDGSHDPDGKMAG
jgi:hypothetical protein